MHRAGRPTRALSAKPGVAARVSSAPSPSTIGCVITSRCSAFNSRHRAVHAATVAGMVCAPGVSAWCETRSGLTTGGRLSLQTDRGRARPFATALQSLRDGGVRASR